MIPISTEEYMPMISKNRFIQLGEAAVLYVACEYEFGVLPADIKESIQSDEEQHNVFCKLVSGITRTCRENDLFKIIRTFPNA